MRLSLVPENRRFYEFLEEAADNMVESMRAVEDLLRHYTDLRVKLERLHELEHKGDEITHRMIDELNRTFITPFDREDMAFLVRRIDDVIDFAWAGAVRLETYAIEEVTPTALEFGRVMLAQAEVLRNAVGMLRDRQAMRGIMTISREVHDLENQADAVLRQALASRYNSGPHTVESLILSMKWSEIYANFEKATDRAEDVADSLQGIVLKYS
jgi:predicted phosphate transport protein (TIGR00153 family)